MWSFSSCFDVLNWKLAFRPSTLIFLKAVSKSIDDESTWINLFVTLHMVSAVFISITGRSYIGLSLYCIVVIVFLRYVNIILNAILLIMMTTCAIKETVSGLNFCTISLYVWSSWELRCPWTKKLTAHAKQPTFMQNASSKEMCCHNG